MIPTKLRAVCVGINQYINPWIPPLEFAENDAQSLAWDLRSVLERRRGDRALWVADPYKDVVTLLGQEATRDNIKEAFSNVLLDRDDEADIGIFYFSGHGVKDPFGQLINAYLGNVDIDPFKPRDTGLGMNDFYDTFIARAKARAVITVVDCCYSGNVAEAKMIDDSLLSLFQRKEGVFVMTSSSNSEISKEDASYKSSVFSHFFREGLLAKDAADQKTGELTLSLLFQYIYSHISRNSEQQPHLGGRGANVVIRRYSPREIWDYKYEKWQTRPETRPQKSEELSNIGPHCWICDQHYDIENMNICMSCGFLYCYRCTGKLERVKETIEGFNGRDNWWRCRCGGLVN